MISPDTTIARLLDEHPTLVEVLADFHPHFRQLRNRLLRRVMAPRITVAQAARIAGVPPDALLRRLREAAGESEPAEPGESAAPTPAATPPPPGLANIPPARQMHLDVRDDIRRGEEPFARIMGAIKAVPDGGALVLRAPFEPIPLYEVLGRRGFASWTECRGPADWMVWFYRATGPVPEPAGSPVATTPGTIRLDVRGLEPPQPMVRVLAELETLGLGETLEVLHNRRPLFLYPQLDDRGFVHETDEPEAGLVRIVIRRGGR